MIRDLRHYCLVPITPIHIGDGNELDPTQYVIRRQRLERFDPVATIAGFSEADRRNYLRALSEASFLVPNKFCRVPQCAARLR